MKHGLDSLAFRIIRTLAATAGALIFLSACQVSELFIPSSQTPTVSPLPPSRTPSPTASSTSSITPTPSPEGTLPVWGRFAAPRGTPATPIPPPMPAADLPEEARAVILAGLDRPNPYLGRSDALILLLYHPRLSKAALISIPPDLFGYLPGETMQRLYSAYPLGGARLLQQAIEYNLGIRPQGWLVVHSDDFALLVDELGGLTVPVLEDIPNTCGDRLYQGDVEMNGEETLCYVRLRQGPDEAARGLRQQQVLSLLLERLASGGNLLKLPELFSLFRSRIDTNLTNLDAVSAIPLALQLSDPKHVAYFRIGKEQTTLWQISEQPPGTVFLPRREAIQAVLQEAIDFINKPSPLSDTILTREVELTASPTVGTPGTPTRAPATRTPRPPTALPSPTAGISRTPTSANTPTPSATSTHSP